MRTAKIGYSLTRRLSQAKVGSMYQDIIREKYDLVGDSKEADVVIIHHPAWHYHLSYQMNPHLHNKYVIACCVSHANDIPDTWKRSLGLVQEVWSCSDYCCDVFSRYHSNVVKVPYVVERDLTVSEEARECAKRLIGYDPECVYFFTIAPLSEPRKNIEALVAGFTAISRNMPKARLVIKAGPDDRASWTPHPQVILLPMTLPHSYINALYELTHVYVSAHHSEAWGTTISDAMLFHKPVLATGCSGNLEYMDEDNAMLLSCYQETIPAGLRGVAIEGGMNWATPHPAAIEESLVKLYGSYNSAETQQKVARAAQRIRSFDRQRAARVIYERIERALALSPAAEPLPETLVAG